MTGNVDDVGCGVDLRVGASCSTVCTVGYTLRAPSSKSISSGGGVTAGSKGSNRLTLKVGTVGCWGDGSTSR